MGARTPQALLEERCARYEAELSKLRAELHEARKAAL
jgi:hypothetical protein